MSGRSCNASLAERRQAEREYFDPIFRAMREKGSLRIAEGVLERFRRCGSASSWARECQFGLARPLGGRDVLEMGCGSGLYTVLLAANGANVWGYDVSEEALRTTQRRAEVNGLSGRINLALAARPEAAFPGRSFGVVFGSLILHHLDPSELRSLGKRLRRLLKPGGWCVFREPVIRAPLLAFLRRVIPYQPFKPSLHEQPLSDADIATVARPFRRCEVRYFDFLHRLHYFLPAHQAPRLAEWDARIFRLWPSLRVLASQAVWRLDA